MGSVLFSSISDLSLLCLASATTKREGCVFPEAMAHHQQGESDLYFNIANLIVFAGLWKEKNQANSQLNSLQSLQVVKSPVILRKKPRMSSYLVPLSANHSPRPSLT